MAEFQSRNRESSNFNSGSASSWAAIAIPFQSRNRESSNFNYILLKAYAAVAVLFQSRNRESSNFNFRDRLRDDVQPWIGFNLVIENLLISTRRSQHGRTTQENVSIS